MKEKANDFAFRYMNANRVHHFLSFNEPEVPVGLEFQHGFFLRITNSRGKIVPFPILGERCDSADRRVLASVGSVEEESAPVLEVTDGEGRYYVDAGDDIFELMQCPQAAVSLIGSENIRTSGGRETAEDSGLLSGFIIEDAICRAAQGLPFSVEKAVKQISCRLNDYPNLLPRGTAKSKRSIYKAWAKYKPVAHLWGALSIFLFPTNFEDEEFDPLSRKFLPTFLAFAEYFRRAGISLRAQNHKPPLLDLKEAWRIPQDVRFPRNIKLFVSTLSSYAPRSLSRRA